MTLRKSKKDGQLSIPDYYADKSVFITGATGFLGKVLIEKLLRSCPRISTIYILLRSKKNKNVEERMADLLDSPMFQRVKHNDASALNKIKPLAGDVMELRLGLSDEDVQTLIDNVSIVFHVAASVRFDDKLKDAVFMNLRGTVETMKIAMEMKQLELFQHISTAYCIKYRDVIEEKLYPPPADWRQIIKIAESMDSHTLEIFAQKLMNFFPNTYTFTKALAEQAVADYSDKIPAMIYRPSIVISAMSEPLPGWVDNFNGPVALIVASGKGIMRTAFVDPEVRCDYIPVDLISRAMIVAAWNNASGFETEQLPVYNAASGGITALSQTETLEIGHSLIEEIPPGDLLWFPGTILTQSQTLYFILFILLHFIPAVLADNLLKYLGRPPLLVRIQRKIYVANMAVSYFLLRQWTFINEKLLSMDNHILKEDYEDFSYNKRDVIPYEFFRTACYGGRQYLLKEDNANLEKARKTYYRMYWVDKITKTILIALFTYLAYKLGYVASLSNLVRGIFNCLSLSID